MNPERILQALRDELHQARERHDLASKQFSDILSDVPSGLPHPDGTQRIQLASREYNEALRAQYEALSRLNDFMVHGTVPPDLIEPEKPSTNF